MSYQGDFNPAAFAIGTPATWPTPATPTDPYTPGMWWALTGTGTVGAIGVQAGDRLYCTTMTPTVDVYGTPAGIDTADVVWSMMDTDQLAAPTADAIYSWPSDPEAGVFVGVADWKLSYEVLGVTDPTALVGSAIVGTATVPALRWVDITPLVRGSSWTHGADQPGGRPRVGVLTITADSRGGLLSSWNTSSVSWAGHGALFRPGVPVRVRVSSVGYDAVHGVGLNVTQGFTVFAGYAEQWPTQLTGLRADEFVTITAVESWSRLARLNLPALSSPCPMERATDRIARWLFTRGSFPYVFEAMVAGKYEDPSFPVDGRNQPLYLQGDTIAGNVMAGVHLAADSTGCYVVGSRNGGLELVPWPGSSLFDRVSEGVLGYLFPATAGTFLELDYLHPRAPGATVPFVADSQVYVNDDLALINEVSVALVGDEAQGVTVEDAPSKARHVGTYSTERNDLITADTDDQEAAFAALIGDNVREVLAADMLRTVYRRLERISIDSAHGAEAFYAAVCARYGLTVWVRDAHLAGDELLTIGSLIAARHDVTPEAGRVRWRTTFSIDTATQEVYTP
jgi:hypothetical protein